MGAVLSDHELRVSMILQTVRQHPFAAIRGGRTIDPQTGKEGIADLGDQSWRVRLLAVRDLVRVGGGAWKALSGALQDEDPHVRHVAAMVLGITGARESADALEDRLVNDTDPVVRGQAAVSLGQLGLEPLAERLAPSLDREPDPDVRHRIEVAINQLRTGRRPSELADAYAAIDEHSFGLVKVGQPALDFDLTSTVGDAWHLADHLGRSPLILIWVFADWCPVCHHEFHDLIELRSEFESRGLTVVTIECHDRFRCRLMTGQEQPPSYRGGNLAAVQPQAAYRGRMWWPHLSDPAGAVGATYGVDPLEFVVHAEWINRPSTFIIDPDGIVRFAYRGTFWGDRPSVAETLEMVQSGRYQFEHPKRLHGG